MFIINFFSFVFVSYNQKLKQKKNNCFKSFTPVVSQHYEEDIHKAFVIRGNSAILKCDIPSFVADFVSVISWHTDQEENFFPGTEYGVFELF